MNNITILGRRWFQRTYGNTYFTAKIYIDGELVHEIPKSYGYGDYYVQAAGEWLHDNGYTNQKAQVNGGYEPLWSYCSQNGIAFTYQATDVARKKDL